LIRFDVLTAVPDFFLSPLNTSILKIASEKKLAEYHIHNLRDYSNNKHKQIDDKMYGGGAGMVLKPEPFFECIKKLRSERDYDAIIITDPGGKIYDQKLAVELSLKKNIMILSGHYKGIDNRVKDKFVTDEISVGNVILTGGEIPALMIIDSVVRLIPGVLHNSESALHDSFQVGNNIEAPCYTRPAEYDGMKVPEVLLKGNHQEIEKWRQEQSELRTRIWKKINRMEL
jgi:tRNA (guanine37-N1)-methyltransferase